MAKRKSDRKEQNISSPQSRLPVANEDWKTALENTTKRFEREYRQEDFDLPSEVEDIPIFEEWKTGSLQNRISSKFWELKTPKKKQTHRNDNQESSPRCNTNKFRLLSFITFNSNAH